MEFRRISEREKFVVIVITLVLVFCYAVFFYKPKSETKSITYTQPVVQQTVVVEKIVLSNESSYQHFIVSGKGFEFSTSEITFNINDTIVIEGNKVFPKNKPSNFIQKY
jgi:hypothetical protein